MESMVLYTIQNGMKDNISENEVYSDNSLLLKWMISNIKKARESDEECAKMNSYFEFAGMGMSVCRTDKGIVFKTTDGEELSLARAFENLSKIRA